MSVERMKDYDRTPKEVTVEDRGRGCRPESRSVQGMTALSTEA